MPKLLEMLELKKDEGDRVELINALANIGSEEAFGVLAGRYAKEDKDARLFTLKALDYLGSGDARAFIEESGTKDKHLPCRVLAHRALQQ